MPRKKAEKIEEGTNEFSSEEVVLLNTREIRFHKLMDLRDELKSEGIDSISKLDAVLSNLKAELKL